MTRYAQNGGLTRFHTGSTHEQNPLSGIPIGNNNSVEENETKQNKFIYSDRIYLDENIVSQYNLPKSLVGKSVADATKFIDNKFRVEMIKFHNRLNMECYLKLQKHKNL